MPSISSAFPARPSPRAPNSGAIFVVLDPFEERAKHPGQSAAAIQGKLFGALSVDPRGPHVRGGAAAGVRHRQCRRLPHDGRGPRRPRLARPAERGLRHDGRRRPHARRHPGVLAVRDQHAGTLSRHRPHQGAALRHQHPGRVRGAADLSRLGLRQRLQLVRPHLPRGGAGRQPRSATTTRTF